MIGLTCFLSAEDLIPQWFPCLESMGDALLGFPFAAQRNEGFPFQVEEILLTDEL
jgi:hypothetical protein